MNSIDWSNKWAETRFGARWAACKAFLDATHGRTVAEFFAMGPYCKCSWVPR